jgi:integrative and conjugative element protein (TIGR02256 family)
MRVFLASLALITILREAQASIDRKETGGILAGFEIADALIVTAAGGPGPEAIRRTDFFQRDLRTADQLLEDAFQTSGALWIGDWHTHTVVDERPSATDSDSYQRLLADEELAFTRFLSLIVTSDSGSFADASIMPWIATKTGIARGHLELGIPGPEAEDLVPDRPANEYRVVVIPEGAA